MTTDEDRPVYFTHAAWIALTPSQRQLIHYRRMARVADLQIAHHARYHAPAELVDLIIHLREDR